MTSSSNPSNSVGPARPLRVAVVGPGGWGRQHMRIFSGRTDTELVAIVGRDPERTRRVAAEFHTASFTDIDSMLEGAQPDMVSVALPNEHHFEPTLRLVRAGASGERGDRSRGRGRSRFRSVAIWWRAQLRQSSARATH